MNDTQIYIEEYYRNLILSKTPRERFAMGIEMYEMARKTAIDSIKKIFPDISETEMKVELFKRFYKNDFSEDEMNAICDWLRKEK